MTRHGSTRVPGQHPTVRELVYCLLYPWVRLLQAWDDWIDRLDAAEGTKVRDMDLIGATVIEDDRRRVYIVTVTVAVPASSLTEALVAVVDTLGTAAMENT